jgi:hypothetical protein
MSIGLERNILGLGLSDNFLQIPYQKTKYHRNTNTLKSIQVYSLVVNIIIIFHPEVGMNFNIEAKEMVKEDVGTSVLFSGRVSCIYAG